MRKLIARTILAILAVVAVSSTASASSIAIGYFTWVVQYNLAGAPVSGKFEVVNQTGANVQQPDFPVTTQLLFNSLNIAIDGGSSNIAQGSMSSPDGGLSFDSASLALPGSQPHMAVLTGQVSPLNIIINGTPWLLTSPNIFTLDPFGGIDGQLGDGQTAIPDLDLEIIYVNGEPVSGQVPEPASMFLLGSGAVGLLARRRRARKA